MNRTIRNSRITNGPTVAGLVEMYREEKMPQRHTTRRGYEAWIKNYILPKWSGNLITDLQPRPVELWLRELNLTQRSKSHIRCVLSLIWDFAMWRGFVALERNPMELVQLRGASKGTRKHANLTPEQFYAVIDQYTNDARMRTMVVALSCLGLRISEALGLKWKDIDWLGRELRIERGVVDHIVDDVKTRNSGASQPLDDAVLAVLQAWKLASSDAKSEDWIFNSPWNSGRPLSYAYVWESLTAAAQRAGVPHISPHCLRHTYRTWLDSTGAPVGVQQRCMRHADIRTTMNAYGSALSEDMREANRKVAQMAIGEHK